MSGGKPLQERVWLVCEAGMARTFEFVLHFVRCVMVTVSPTQNIIIICYPRKTTNILGSDPGSTIPV